MTLLRLEGITASAAHRAASLREVLAPFGTARPLEDAASAALWRAIRDVLPFAASGALGAWPVWRIVCPPASGGALGSALARETGGEVDLRLGRRADLGGAAAEARRTGRAACVSASMPLGGHATLLRASDDVRRSVDVFHPQAPGVAALSERVRAELRSEEHSQPGPDDAGRCGMKTEFTPRAARRSRHRGSRQDPARLRALRLLHRDLSDLCAARRRAR